MPSFPINMRIEWFAPGMSITDGEPLVLLAPGQMSYRVQKEIGGFEAPEFAFGSIVTPGVDGSSFGSVRASRSELVVPVFMRADSRAEMRRMKSDLVSALRPRDNLPGVLMVTNDEGDESATARYVEAMYRGGLEGDGSKGGWGTWWQFTLRFECAGPFWYSRDPLTATWQGNGENNSLLPFRIPFRLAAYGVAEVDTLDVTGDADTWPSFDLRGPFNRVRVTTQRSLRLRNVLPDAFWEVNRVTSAGEVVRVITKPGEADVELHYVQPDGSLVFGARIYSAKSSASVFVPLQAGDALDVAADGTSGDTFLSLSAQESWLTSS